MFPEATDWLLANHDRNPRETAAGAVPYLKLTGVVAGGWQMARAARIARDLTQTGENGSAFLRGKIATSRFYAEHVLPEAEAWRLEVTAGAAFREQFHTLRTSRAAAARPPRRRRD